MSEHDFWLVWGQDTQRVTFKHLSRESAEDEAKRLARNNPGQRFYVVRPMSLAIKIDVHTRKLDAPIRARDCDDDIPF